MDKKEKRKKLVCTICGQEILKNPNKSGKRYAVRKCDPIICDICIHDLAEIDDNNQEKFDAKSYTKIIQKPVKPYSIAEKVSIETTKNVEEKSLKEIISSVKSVIKGQDEHIKQIATSIYKNLKIDNLEIKSNIIALGESGNGKTAIIKLLAEIFNVPVVIEDATRFTEAGYFGPSADDMIKDLYKAAGDNIRKAERGILVIDEGDKKDASKDAGRDVSGEQVLFSLLKILEGTKVPITEPDGDMLGYMDTSRVTIIFIGAFPSLPKIREKRINGKGVMGFNTGAAQDVVKNKGYIPEDFIQAGFSKEFIGRFDMIIELNKLTVADLQDITRNSKKSTLLSYVKALGDKGIKVNYADEIIYEIAEEAAKLKIGARGIKTVVQEMFKNIMFQVLLEEKIYTECNVRKETVHDSTNYILI